MNVMKNRTSRRAFFVSGGAALGAGVATTAGAAMLSGEKAQAGKDQLQPLQQQLAAAADREAIRQLQIAFASLIENGRYGAVAELFDDTARLDLSGETAVGRNAIAHLFAAQYAQQQAAAMHGAYRPNARQQNDEFAIDADQRHASAVYHVDVALGSPLQGDSTVAQMARLQGQMADRRWESGRLMATYVKTAGQWRISSLGYLPS